MVIPSTSSDYGTIINKQKSNTQVLHRDIHLLIWQPNNRWRISRSRISSGGGVLL